MYMTNCFFFYLIMRCSFHNLSIGRVCTTLFRSPAPLSLSPIVRITFLYTFRYMRRFFFLYLPPHPPIHPSNQSSNSSVLGALLQCFPFFFFVVQFSISFSSLSFSTVYIEQLTSVYLLNIFDKGRKHLKGGGGNKFFISLLVPALILFGNFSFSQQ